MRGFFFCADEKIYLGPAALTGPKETDRSMASETNEGSPPRRSFIAVTLSLAAGFCMLAELSSWKCRAANADAFGVSRTRSGDLQFAQGSSPSAHSWTPSPTQEASAPPAAPSLLLTMTEHGGAVVALAFSSDGRLLASGSYDHTGKLRDLAAGKVLHTLAGGTKVNSVAFSPDGMTVALGSDDSITLWDTATGQLSRTLKGHSGNVFCIAISADGKRLASASADHTVILWDLRTGQQVRTLKGHGDVVRSVAFSPDGSFLASGSGDKSIRLWNVMTGEPIRTLYGHTAIPAFVAFSPDGRLLASAGIDMTVRLWDTLSGDLLRTLDHPKQVSSVAFSPDGSVVASGCVDGVVRLWQSASGQILGSLTGPIASVLAVAYSPDGSKIASGSWDNTIKLWDVSAVKGGR